jgi:hypothetical protein
MLTSVPNIIGLKKLGCSACRMLTSIPHINSLKKLDYFDCPWINRGGNPKYKNNINKLITLQRFCKKNYKYFVFKRWVKSQEFNEWFYAPENVGGIKHKQMMERVISAH